MRPIEILAEIWRDAALPAAALDWVRLHGEDPVLPSSFRVGAAAQVSVAAAGLAAAELWRARGGEAQAIAVEMRHAAVEFRSERYLRVERGPDRRGWDRIAGLYRAADGWVRLHTNFPHHRDGVLRLLGCAYDREAVQAALRPWRAAEFEDAAAQAGLCVTASRSFAEWDAHPQGQAVPDLPLLAIRRIGDAPPKPLPPAARPLDGIRVLDLTRVIAGPVCGRVLAAHGAEVLRITGPHLAALPLLDIDTGRGKRSAHLDLRDADGQERLRALLRGADIFVQGYRPGTLAARGFGPEAAAAHQPGIIYVSLSAYGAAGPWRDRRGFDSLVQNANGLNQAEAEAAGAEAPKPLPAQALDYASGYLMAFGAMAALLRRAAEGGSWLVEVSLARTGHWLRGLGRVQNGFTCPDPGPEDVADLMEASESPFGRVEAVRHPAILSATPAHWARPPAPLGTHAPEWSE